MEIVLSTSCNPIHEGHLAILDDAAKYFTDDYVGRPSTYIDICKKNADKSEISKEDLDTRVSNLRRHLVQSNLRHSIITTKSPLFAEKRAELFFPQSEVIFVVGIDTYLRLIDSKYYGGEDSFRIIFKLLDRLKTRFMVYPRNGVKYEPTCISWIDNLVIYRDSFKEINISSTELRNKQCQTK